MRERRYELVGTRWLGDGGDYDGSQLHSHFVREAGGITSDGVVAFIGRCDVRGDRLVDLEDAAAGETIVAERMLHFIGEHFATGLREANLLLRLFVTIAVEVLRERGIVAKRDGDDIFVGERKLSVAIATASPTSVLFHFGVNVDPGGAPVPAVGLQEFGIDPRDFAVAVLDRYCRECESIEHALCKVRGVR